MESSSRLLLVMESICGGGEHWAKPKENQRKETVIDFHLYVGHRAPIKYEILCTAPVVGMHKIEFSQKAGYFSQKVS